MRVFLGIIFLASILIACTGQEEKTSYNVHVVDFYKGKSKGELHEIVEEVYKDSLVPILYFTATWCKPCQAFKKTLKEKVVQDSLENVCLIMVDVDEDRRKLSMKYKVNAVPTFLKLDELSGEEKRIDSRAWGTPDPEVIASVMASFSRD